MYRDHTLSERATMALSAPMIAVGLFIVALAPTWAERGAGGFLVIGASLAIAAWDWPVRAFGWTVALIGAPMVAVILTGSSRVGTP